jgi:cellulose synthase/poly-beta-1,6-N-acetylglucosamine synthase-like glycosyltransferase
MILLWIIIPLFVLYSLLIIYYWQCWQSIPPFIPSQLLSHPRISVIIPARNEEQNIGSLLKAIEQQTYPKEKFEVIVIDDHSEDDTAAIVKQHANVLLLQLRDQGINSYKKRAIEAGIEAASGDIIVTTDADCMPPQTWLQTIVAFKEETKAVFITAPVVIDCNSSIVQIFQALDFMVLQGITGAAVSKNQLTMCNGANLCYEKKVFNEVGGFTGIDHIASGDDMLLMHKMWKRHPQSVYYLRSKTATVSTQPVKTWRDFFNQRIRWASKAAQYDDKRILPVLLLVYLFNLSFLVLLVAGFRDFRYWIFIAALWILKTLVELPLFYSLCSFFNKQWALKWFFFFQPLHVFYTIISGLFGQFGKYEWKGRKVR